MADSKVPETNPAGSAGVIGHLSALVAALLLYLQARLLLLGLESKEAALHYALLVVWAGAALVLCFFGYIFLCIGCAFAIAYFFSNPSAWIWVMLGFGAVHLAIAILCVLIARGKIFAPMFRETISELKKDQLWLSREKLNEKPN